MKVVIVSQKSPKTPKIQSPIPIRYEMKGFNSLLGSHFDHYYLNYDEFTWDNPSPDIFKVSNGTWLQLLSLFENTIQLLKVKWKRILTVQWSLP